MARRCIARSLLPVSRLALQPRMLLLQPRKGFAVVYGIAFTPGPSPRGRGGTWGIPPHERMDVKTGQRACQPKPTLRQPFPSLRKGDCPRAIAYQITNLPFPRPHRHSRESGNPNPCPSISSRRKARPPNRHSACPVPRYGGESRNPEINRRLIAVAQLIIAATGFSQQSKWRVLTVRMRLPYPNRPAKTLTTNGCHASIPHQIS